jgi:hypothetical protein
MKLNLLAIFTVFLLAKLALAGGSTVGNGGGTVVCRDVNHQITSIELLDFYEARTLRNITIDIQSIPGTWQQKAAAVIARIRPKSEFRFQLYSQWLSTFETNSKILSDVQFSTIPDSGYIGMPNGCEFEQAAIQRAPMFPGDARYFLNAELWNLMDDTQKAGLALHEIIYREAIGYGHSTSIRSRYLTATYSSPSFAPMSVSDYWNILIDANFETTDRLMPVELLGSLRTIVDTTRLTQPGPTDPSSPKITLDDRIMMQLGTCDADCAHFIRSPDKDYQNGSWTTILSQDPQRLILKKNSVKEDIDLDYVESKVFDLDSFPSGTFEIYIGQADRNSQPALLEVYDPKRTTSSNDGMSALSVAFEKDPQKVWQWKTYVGKSLNILNPLTNTSNLNFLSSNSPCDFGMIDFQNDVPKMIVKYEPQWENWPECKNTLSTSESLLVGSLFKNGFARAPLDSVALENGEHISGVLYDLNHENSLANPQVDYYTWTSIGWSYTPGLVVCGKSLDQPDLSMPHACLHPSINSSGLVTSFTVIDHSPTIWAGSFNFAYVALGSKIEVEPVRGTVTQFVIRDSYTWINNKQSIIIPAGSTVHLHETSITGFEPPVQGNPS